MSVRRATVDDAAALASLCAEVQALHVAAMPHLYRRFDDLAPVIADFRDRLGDDARASWIAEVDGVAAGYVCTQVVRQAAHVYALARAHLYVDQMGVRADLRGRGVGRALIDEVRAHARALALPRVVLDVQGFNAGAEAFYRRLGFTTRKHTMDLTP
ncbi:MAG: GNAT family N-acetyltransferase [Kofleriaceae bacterium]|nr:GNAT family N-acetyltransferase [Kofleriaceae bacterium]MCB9573106.1 GNAT family N-acetyltransferase [Kofleriaceae bacterium]